MSAEFQDDLADGGGRRPTQFEVIGVRDYLKRHNRDASVRKTHDELVARNYKISMASVGRNLKGIAGGNPPDVKSPIQPAEKRTQLERKHAKTEQPKVQISPELLGIKPPTEDDTTVIPRMAALIANNNSSTQLAIDENRARMALNQIIAQTMASRPELLLLDMRGTAALVDALTVAAKLSGGASIDISVHLPGDKDSSLQPEMKDVTPQRSALVTEIDNWRHKQVGAQGA